MALGPSPLHIRVRLYIIPEYGHENALFISLKYKRIAIRTIQDMLKRYTTALFDENTKISSQDLRNFYIDNVYNTVQSLSATASLCGTLDDTIYDMYKADVVERQVNTLICL